MSAEASAELPSAGVSGAGSRAPALGGETPARARKGEPLGVALEVRRGEEDAQLRGVAARGVARELVQVRAQLVRAVAHERVVRGEAQRLLLRPRRHEVPLVRLPQQVGERDEVPEPAPHRRVPSFVLRERRGVAHHDAHLVRHHLLAEGRARREAHLRVRHGDGQAAGELFAAAAERVLRLDDLAGEYRARGRFAAARSHGRLAVAERFAAAAGVQSDGAHHARARLRWRLQKTHPRTTTPPRSSRTLRRPAVHHGVRVRGRRREQIAIARASGAGAHRRRGGRGRGRRGRRRGRRRGGASGSARGGGVGGVAPRRAALASRRRARGRPRGALPASRA